jgi:hypothetical protein
MKLYLGDKKMAQGQVDQTLTTILILENVISELIKIIRDKS